MTPREYFKFQLGARQKTPSLDFDDEIKEDVESFKVFFLLRRIEDDGRTLITKVRSCMTDEIEERVGTLKFLGYGTEMLPIFEDNEPAETILLI